MRQQYLRIKHQYPEAIVFFRLGDFYETFDEDARVTSRELEITLTSREMGKGRRVPLAGIPYHALDNYMARLIGRGYKVAICEQLTPPGKGLVERDVVRLITPGTVIEPALIEGKLNNYLVGIVAEGNQVGIAYADITTGEFAVTQLDQEQLLPELGRLNPSEIVVPEGMEIHGLSALSFFVSTVSNWQPELDYTRRLLMEHFGVSSLEGYGCAALPLAIEAASLVLCYLQQTQRGNPNILNTLHTYSTANYMTLDNQTRHNLELFEDNYSKDASGSILAVIDLTQTPMGGRLIRRWLGQPLLDIVVLKQRQNAVADMYENTLARRTIMGLFKRMSDLERLVKRIGSGYANPRDLVSLRRSLEIIPHMHDVLKEAGVISWLAEKLASPEDVTELIARAIVDEPSLTWGEGEIIREGFYTELDEIRYTSKEARSYLTSLEHHERERTGIRSLKVGYNKVFGYYIEVSKSNLNRVPEDYIRKQTLTEAERFFTPELKEYETLILNARERMSELEVAAFREICRQVSEQAAHITSVAEAVALLDVFCALAEVAARYRYVRPELNEGDEIIITGGRHPVVERALFEAGFVPNDVYLGKDTRIIILTGPNMSGKSTYLRQVAVIVLLAQIGSFVPANSATIGIVDRIFTRIGAREDIAAGQSTFMMEMVETANILNNASPHSLIILDEIGRGTSTYDGLSIAQAVVEHIHNSPGLGSKTLFATHYHEMVELAESLPSVKNFNVAVVEERGKVIFLHTIIPGGADKSYGIHVAQLAGLPHPVIQRAQNILAHLEGNSHHLEVPKSPRSHQSEKRQIQMPLFE